MRNNKILIFIFILALINITNTSYILTTQEITNSVLKPKDQIKIGEPVLRTTDDYNWWSYIPKSIQKKGVNYILFEESQAAFEDYQRSTDDALNNINQFKVIAEENKFILITVAFPRNFNNNYYPQGINYNSMRNSTPDFFYRPDLKIKNIITEFRGILTNTGYIISEKVFVAGFSAGGMFANRFTLLHPEYVKAAAIGQSGGWLSMPISEYNGSNLNWPMGINDFELLTGSEYNKQEELKKVPQFIFIGDNDNTNTYSDEPLPTKSEINIWGNSDPKRLLNQYNFLNNNDYNVEFTLYPGIGHDYIKDMKNDIINFFNGIRELDSDKDGLKDDEEIYIYFTNPYNGDSDSDDLLDGKEIIEYSTDPNNNDSDNDMLTDGEEINRYGTNPNLSDSDGDGFSDYNEISLNADPNNSNNIPIASTSGFYFMTLITVIMLFILKFKLKSQNRHK